MYICILYMYGWMDGCACMYVCMWQYMASFGFLCAGARTSCHPHDLSRSPTPRSRTHKRTHAQTHTHTHAHTETERQTNSACLFHAELKHSPCQHHFLASEHTSELTKKGHDHRTLGVSWSQTVKPKSRELACSNMLRNVASHAKTPRHR